MEEEGWSVVRGHADRDRKVQSKAAPKSPASKATARRLPVSAASVKKNDSVLPARRSNISSGAADAVAAGEKDPASVKMETAEWKKEGRQFALSAQNFNAAFPQLSASSPSKGSKASGHAIAPSAARLKNISVPPASATATPSAASNKRPKKVTLFDMILSSQAPRAVKPVQRAPMKTTVETVSSKHIVRKKKKRLSNLKKKLLKERLAYHRSLLVVDRQQGEAASGDTQGRVDQGGSGTDAPGGSSVVCLSNFVDDDLEDEDELQEVIDSAAEIMAAFGTVLGVKVSAKTLLVTFDSIAAAAAACKAVDGSVYGGVSVTASLVEQPFQSEEIATISSQAHLVTDRMTAAPSLAATVLHDPLSGGLESKRQLYDNHSIVSVSNFVFPQDIEEPEEAQDVLRDCLLLCERFHPRALWLEGADVTTQPLYIGHRATPTSCACGVLEFNNIEAAAACRDFICASTNASAYISKRPERWSAEWDASVLFGAKYSDTLSKINDESYNSPLRLEMNNVFCVKIQNFVSADEIADEGERADIINDIRSLCAHRMSENKRLRPNSLEPLESFVSEDAVTVDCVLFGGVSSLDESEGLLDVYVIVNWKNHHLQDAVYLSSVLDGVAVGGTALDLSIVCLYNSVLDNLFSLCSRGEGNQRPPAIQDLDGSLVRFSGTECHDMKDYVSYASDATVCIAVVGLPWRTRRRLTTSSGENLVSSDPMLLLNTPMWLYDWKLNMLRIAGLQNYRNLFDYVAEDADVIKEHDVPAAPILDFENSIPNYFYDLSHVSMIPIDVSYGPVDAETSWKSNLSLDICIAFETIDDALAAQLYLDGLVIGGSRLVSFISLCPEKAPKSVCNGIVSKATTSAFSSMSVLDVDGGKMGLSAGAAEFVPRMRISDAAVGSAHHEKAAVATSVGTEKSHEVSKAAALPRDGLAVSRLPRRSSFEFDLKHADDELNKVIKDFLLALAGFQQRVKETDPINFNRKRRIVMGIKQVTNSVKSGRAKIVFIAPDYEVSEALDEKMDVLVAEAKARELPIMYCLSRRGLAAAIRSSMRQVVVGVLDGDGAHDAFKIITQFIRE